MIVEQGLLIGRPDGMEKAVASFFSRCRRALFFQEFQEVSFSDDFCPEMILILQHWPDEFSAQQVDKLLQAYPLGRIICCYGPWCESDNRTRNFWPTAVRVPLADVQHRIDLECRVIQGEVDPLERTAGFDELFAFEQQRPDNKLQ